MQASSDLSILDYDIPFSIVFVVSACVELLAIIGIMASVTWQVLIVAIFSLVASTYVQVGPNFSFLFSSITFLHQWDDGANRSCVVSRGII